MNNRYYPEACMCRHPAPSRLIPGRCAWCGGIVPPAVRAMWALEREMDGIPSGGAIAAIVALALALLVMIAVGRITLVASRHDPTPPSVSTLTGEEVRP